MEDMINHSFYEVFQNGDRKWLIAYADVALNGVQRTLHDYSPEIDKTLTIRCYQPEPGYCACVLLEDLKISQSTLSYHMKILCDSGIVVGRAEGKWTHYSISAEGSRRAKELLELLTTVKPACESSCTCRQ